MLPSITHTQKVTGEMRSFLRELRKRVPIAIVGGSDLSKIKEQMGADGTAYGSLTFTRSFSHTRPVLENADYVFSENGLEAYKHGELLAVQSIKTHLGEEHLKRMINWFLRYIADLDIPVKRGTFVEFRNGMLNVSPIGRNCSQEEREAFFAYDKVSFNSTSAHCFLCCVPPTHTHVHSETTCGSQEHHVREVMVEKARAEFADLDLTFSIGGQISFDVFPRGWDKTYALRFLDEYDEVYFFGDRTQEEGNDYEIAHSPRVKQSFTVASPEDTMQKLTALFLQ